MVSLTPGADDGVLLVDGVPAALPGPLVGVEVDRPLLKDLSADPPFIAPLPTTRFTVTIRLPVGPADEFTLARGHDWTHAHGEPLADADKLAAIGRIHRSNQMLNPVAGRFYCVHCRFAWPCPTRRALDGDPHAVDGNTAP
jgi:hypothetical protein